MAWSALGGLSDLQWLEVAINTNMTNQSGYIANGAGAITLTLPTTSNLGNEIEIVGKGAGGFVIGQNAGQTIYYGGATSTAGVGGSAASTIQYQAILLRCITVDTEWEIISSNAPVTIT